MYTAQVDESNFVSLLKKKDERALDYVIETYGGLIKAIVQKHLHCFPDKCGECINDILLAVWEQIHHFDCNRNSFTGWLAAVCKYKAIDYKRKYYKQLYESPLSEEENLSQSDQDDPEQKVLAQEISEETQELLQYLSEDDKALFWDCYVKGEPVEQLAKKRKVNVSVLYNRISRGKKKIRQCKEAKL